MTLEPALPESNSARALCMATCSDDWPEAELHFANAVALAPRSAIAHVYQGFFLGTLHRFDEAATAVTKAMELDPLSPFVHALAAFTMYDAGRHTDAIQYAERALDLHPDLAVGLWALGLAC